MGSSSRLLISRRHDHVGTVTGQLADRLQSQTPVATGDDCDLARLIGDVCR